jgi:GAF domain-containing protein
MTDEGALLDELARVARDVGPAVSPLDHQSLLASLTDTARRLFGAQAVSLALLDDDEDELVYVTAAGAGSQAVTGMRMPADQGIAGWVVQSGQPVAVNDVRRDPRWSAARAERSGYLPTSILAVPVVSPRRTLGVLSILDRAVDRTGAESDMQTAAVLADQTALALEATRAFTDLARVLLLALADAAARDGSLRAALGAAAGRLPREDADTAAVAAVFARLARHGPAERRLVLRIVETVLDHLDGGRP